MRTVAVIASASGLCISHCTDARTEITVYLIWNVSCLLILSCIRWTEFIQHNREVAETVVGGLVSLELRLVSYNDKEVAAPDLHQCPVTVCAPAVRQNHLSRLLFSSAFKQETKRPFIWREAVKRRRDRGWNREREGERERERERGGLGVGLRRREGGEKEVSKTADPGMLVDGAT